MGLKTVPPTPQGVLAKHTRHKSICVWLGVWGLHLTLCLGFPVCTEAAWAILCSF